MPWNSWCLVDLVDRMLVVSIVVEVGETEEIWKTMRFEDKRSQISHGCDGE